MPPHKNVLFFVADDLGKYLGPYGCRTVSTPHVDQFAKEGVRFDMAYASTASCSGSRSTIYSGLHTHENGQYGLGAVATHFQTFKFVDTIPALFNKAGYLTGVVGKIHVGTKDVYPWTVFDDIETRDAAKYADHVDDFLNQAKTEDKPFHLVVASHDTHRDMSRGGFANNQGPFDPRVKPYKTTPDKVDIPDWLVDTPGLRQELVEYYESINRLDQAFGMILENLKKHNLLDDTLVFFTSDNGPPFINAKTTLFESGTCLPFIVRDPRLVAQGQLGIVNPNMVSFIDILPTMLDYCGLPSDLRVHDLSPSRRGRSILPVLHRSDVAPENEWQHHIWGSHTYHQREQPWPTRVLRTRKFKYHRNIFWKLDFPLSTDIYASLSFEDVRNMSPVMLGKRRIEDFCERPPELLYDIEKDPIEVVNLAQDPAYKSVLESFRAKMTEWQWETEDIWLFKDGQSWRGLVGHLADDKMQMPDRFDFVATRPGNRDGPIYECIGDPNMSVRGGALYSGKANQLQKAKTGQGY